jgi:SAM-dependent methyltransferase
MSGPVAPPGSWVGADAYEAYVGRWSRLVAPRFLDWLAVPPGRRWLDVGCGTGALSQAVLATADPAEVVGVDPSLPFVAHAAVQVPDARAAFRKGDAERLPVDNGSFDAVVSGLVLNFVPDQPAALREMRRAAQPDGVVAAYVWDYAGGMQMMRYFWDAAIALDPASAEKDQARRFPICRPEPLTELFTGARLTAVEIQPIEITTHFRDFDDYWSPFLAGQGPAPSYVTSLPEDRRTALRERIRSALPAAPDGSISLISRAWAVRGSK